MTPVRHHLRPHVDLELARAAASRRSGDLPTAWTSLERAHVLSQPSAWLHTRVHVAMLVLAVRARDGRELFGQIVRLAVAALGSALGRYPIGNTGRARVPIARPMPIAPDLAAILDRTGASPLDAAGVEVQRSDGRDADAAAVERPGLPRRGDDPLPGTGSARG